MPDTDPRPIASLRTVALLSLVGGALAGAGTVAATRLLVPDTAPSEAIRTVAPTTPSAAPPAPADSPDALREAFATAEAERSQLAGSLLALNRRAEALEGQLAELARRPPAAAPSVDPEGALPSGEDDDILVADEGTGQANGDEEPVDPLIAAGLDPQSAADIRSRRDAFQLARLELVDQATREGWADSEQFGERLSELEATRPDLRDELGDDAYDRYLFEEGGNNRVGIAAVIAGSAAAQAGLVPGDVVLSYAGERLFRMPELQAATRAGSRGEYVQLGVLRGGEIVAIDLPRGPLGVTLNGLRDEPN